MPWNITAFCRFLNLVHDVRMAWDQYFHCRVATTTMYISTTCSTPFILSMTFKRFYSIIRPHKAASFNTINRAKIIIICCIVFSIVFNIPRLFISRTFGRQCIPLGNAFLGNPYYQFYYWIFFIENYALPFVLLLTMNSFIIRTLSKRPILQSPVSESQGHGQGEGHQSKIKSSEKQIYIMLLVVTFGFLILITPAYIFFIYIWLVDYMKSGKSLALYYFLYHFGHKTYNTNYGINFYLYVISGKKFRNDLIQLFQKRKWLNHNFNSSSVISMNTINSSL